ncbi:MAG: Chaperone protein DnaJ [Chlamydiae bacterium]|nr:Chaperone protein DnaJ [Chlamydiota bacterium]
MSRLDSCREYAQTKWNDCQPYAMKWCLSRYEVDNDPQGYLRFDRHANLGRVVSLINLPAEVVRPVCILIGEPVIIVYKITSGIAALPIAVTLVGIALLIAPFNRSAAHSLNEKHVVVLTFGLKNLAHGTLEALQFCIAAPILIPPLVILVIFKVVSASLGIFCPEIGRYARLNFDVVRWLQLRTPESKQALKFFGLDTKATQGDLKRVYKKLALELHPDKSTGSEEQFKLLGTYYEHLQKVLKPGKARAALAAPISCPAPAEPQPCPSQFRQSID